MELRAYLAILWRRKWIIIVVACLTGIVANTGTLLMTPIYVASTTLRVPTGNGGPVDRLGWDEIQYADRLMNTYAQITTSGPMLAQLAQQLGLQKPPEIEVKILANTELMQIIVEDRNPTVAAKAANTLAEILTAQAIETKVSVVEPAVVPPAPSKPRKELNIALGLLVGLAGGIGLAFLFENLDTTLYTTQQIEQVTKLSTLGKIPMRRKQRHITVFNSNSAQEEAFRRLRTNLVALGHGAPLHALLVTSAEPGEGKSTVVANLASTIAKAGQKVIVVDGDLRESSLHKVFDLSNKVGLSNILKQEASLDEAMQDSKIPGVKVLTSGPVPSNPTELLGSPKMFALIKHLTQQFDLVLLDTPPLLTVADAAVLAPSVDGVMLVVARARSRREAVQAAHQQLAKVKARSVGLVVNRAEQNGTAVYRR